MALKRKAWKGMARIACQFCCRHQRAAVQLRDRGMRHHDILRQTSPGRVEALLYRSRTDRRRRPLRLAPRHVCSHSRPCNGHHRRHLHSHQNLRQHLHARAALPRSAPISSKTRLLSRHCRPQAVVMSGVSLPRRMLLQWKSYPHVNHKAMAQKERWHQMRPSQRKLLIYL